MYAYVKGYAKKNYEWAEADLANMPLDQILRDYQSAKIVVKWHDNEVVYAINFSDNEKLIQISDRTLTLSVWLSQFTEEVLVATSAPASLADAKCVLFFDLANKVAAIEKANVNYGEGVVLPVGMDTDIRFKSTGAKQEELSKENIQANMMIAVNGQIMPTQIRGDWTYIIDAAAKIEHENSNSVTVIDFTDIGGITKIPLTAEGIRVIPTTANDIANHERRFVLTIPEEHSGKTVMTVIDGHLHFPGTITKLIGANEVLVTIDIRRAMLRNLERFGKDLRFADAANVSGNGFNIASFDLVKYLTLTHCMLVILNSPDVGIMREMVYNCGGAGTYSHYRAPKGIMIFENGELAPYYVNDYSAWEVALSTTVENKKKRYLAETANWATLGAITTALENMPVRSNIKKTMDAYLVDIYKF